MEEVKIMEYSNPRMKAEIENWPWGSHRTKAIFSIETHPLRGQRATRITINPKNGKLCAPKKTTYSKRARIVDGSDGRTYILEDWGWRIQLRKSDILHDHEGISSSDTNSNDQERFKKLALLF